MTDQKKESNGKRAIAVAFAIGFELLALVLAGIYVGDSLEKYMRNQSATANLGSIIGCLLGLSLWFWRLMKSKRYLF